LAALSFRSCNPGCFMKSPLYVPWHQLFSLEEHLLSQNMISLERRKTRILR
jgi:hypothetical protein